MARNTIDRGHRVTNFDVGLTIDVLSATPARQGHLVPLLLPCSGCDVLPYPRLSDGSRVTGGRFSLTKESTSVPGTVLWFCEIGDGH